MKDSSEGERALVLCTTLRYRTAVRMDEAFTLLRAPSCPSEPPQAPAPHPVAHLSPSPARRSLTHVVPGCYTPPGRAAVFIYLLFSPLPSQRGRTRRAPARPGPLPPAGRPPPRQRRKQLGRAAAHAPCAARRKRLRPGWAGRCQAGKGQGGGGEGWCACAGRRRAGRHGRHGRWGGRREGRGRCSGAPPGVPGANGGGRGGR